MRALVFLDQLTNNLHPFASSAREAGNGCQSMGIDVVYYHVTEVIDLTVINKIINSGQIDFAVVGAIGSGNRPLYNPAMSGGLSVPFFCTGVNNDFTGDIKGIIGFYTGDVQGTIAQAQLAGRNLFTSGRRFELDTTLVAPEASTAIVTGLASNAEDDAVACWKYTPDGVSFVYYSYTTQGSSMLHCLMQQAINDGQLAKPPLKSPQVLNIDHFGVGVTTGTGLQPEIITFLGNLLRQHSGVCYASMSQISIPDYTATQIANFRAYADVFRYIASHDHSTINLATSGYTSATGFNNAIASQETKTAIDASYQSTKALIESLLLVVNEDFSHFAQNRVGNNYWQLAQDRVSILADPANTTPKMGYGIKMGRGEIQVDNSIMHPSIQKSTIHWMAKKTYMYGIQHGGSSRDAGAASVGDAIDLPKDYLSFTDNLKPHFDAQMQYHHTNDFEEPVLGFISSGEEVSRGKETWQQGSDYALFCKDTIQFGANILNYL